MASSEYTSSLIGAIDQGTGSTRFLVFSATTAQLITSHQVEIRHYYPKPNWFELDANEILTSTKQCIESVCEKLTLLNFDVRNIKCVGITNHRESTVVWDKTTGLPLYNVLVWCDGRTEGLATLLAKHLGGKYKLQKRSGLVIHPYFSALKLRWLLNFVPQVQEAAANGNLMVGTVDTWLIWNLTGGTMGGSFVTDVTNASRTLLMNINTLQWDPHLLKTFGVDVKVLPSIKSSSEIYGKILDGSLDGVPISGCLGDQQAALVGEACFLERMCKNTYGTGCFMLTNTGTRPVFSKYGLLTTVAYKLGPNEPAYYALEGSVAVAGTCVRWLRDNLKIIQSSQEIEELASSVNDTGDVYFVPAFSGLYAPYWHSQARGLIIGLTTFTTKAHVARAALEAVCFQTREVLEAMCKDSGVGLSSLKLMVDGGMTKNDFFMQIQADIIGACIIRPQLVETTAFGAAVAAGMAKGVELWDQHYIENHPPAFHQFTPEVAQSDVDAKYMRWKKAVRRSMNWTSDSNENNDSVCWAMVRPVLLPCAALGLGALAAVVFWKWLSSRK